MISCVFIVQCVYQLYWFLPAYRGYLSFMPFVTDAYITITYYHT